MPSFTFCCTFLCTTGFSVALRTLIQVLPHLPHHDKLLHATGFAAKNALTSPTQNTSSNGFCPGAEGGKSSVFMMIAKSRPSHRDWANDIDPEVWPLWEDTGFGTRLTRKEGRGPIPLTAMIQSVGES